MVKLRLGYIGVKNRAQADIDAKMPHEEVLKSEENFFANHPSYNDLPKEMLGS